MSTKQKLRILIIDDEEIIHTSIGRYLDHQGHEVHHAYDGFEGIEMLHKTECDLTLLDVQLPGESGLELLPHIRSENPDMSVVIITGYGTMDIAIQALRAGAADFLTKPIMQPDLDTVVERSGQFQALMRDRRRLREKIGFMQISGPHKVRPARIIGKSEATEKIRRQVRLAVESHCDMILITGETGTGKEVVSREMHFLSSRSENPFIAVNCPAIPESLVESELFGHVKGAFTGAIDDRAGCFELADGGTLFLDEISELAVAAQAKILRVLETRTVRRVGGAIGNAVNVRVVATTNVPLERLVEEKKFRSDLFYRLNRFTIGLAPLRKRREDILPLARRFLSVYCRDRGRETMRFSEEAANRLLAYDFPGNARELRNLVERAAILSDGAQIAALDIDLPSDSGRCRDSAVVSIIENERSRIELTLERVRWNRREAAKFLEMPYSTLRNKIDRYGIG